MSDRYEMELEELSTLVYDAMLDLDISIDMEGPCSEFTSRESNPTACSWCAFDDEEH